MSEIALLLRLCGHEGVSTLLRVLRRLFIVDQVMAENVERLFRWHVEDMGSARRAQFGPLPSYSPRFLIWRKNFNEGLRKAGLPE